MFSCQLKDGRPQIFTARSGRLFTRWKTSSASDAEWSGWHEFLNDTVGVTSYTGEGAGGSLDDGSPVIFAISDYKPAVGYHGDVFVSWKRRMGAADSEWKSARIYNGEYDLSQIHSAPPSARPSAIAAVPLPNGAVQVFIAINEYGNSCDPIPLRTAWTEPLSVDDILYNEIDWESDKGPFDRFDIGIGSNLGAQPFPFTSMTASALADGRAQLWGSYGAAIYTTWKETTQPNSAWVPWQVHGPAPEPIRSLASGRLPDGRVQLFASLVGSNVVTMWKIGTDRNSGWSDWERWSAPKPGNVAVATLPDGGLQFWLDAGDAIFTRWKLTVDPNSGWSDWSNFSSP